MTCPITTDPSRAAEVLRNGGLVAIPTETVYGLAALALQPDCVARIFAAKRRPHFDPLIVHVTNIEMATSLASEWTGLTDRLARRFWPGPLTLVVPKKPIVPDLVTSGLASVAIRMPDHPLTRELLGQLDAPLAAPSANRFGRLSPTTAEHVASQLGDDIDLILDGGPCRCGVESTIITAGNNDYSILRPGGLTSEELEQATGLQPIAPDSRYQGRMPGDLPSHYAPRLPLILVEDWSNVARENEEWRVTALSGETYRFRAIGLLALGSIPTPLAGCPAEVLPDDPHLVATTADFFPALHRLEELPVKAIIAKRFPDHGLGRALNNRLDRAAAKQG